MTGILRAACLAVMCGVGAVGASETGQSVTAQISADAPDPATRVAWLQALDLMRSGSPRAALPILERLVTNYPENGRFRLELARALYLVEDDQRARYHFEYALSGSLSLNEIKAAQEYLTAMDTRKAWRGQARVAVVPQTNPWQRSGLQFVEIGGILLLPLPQVERATGLELGLGVTWQPRLADDLYGRVHLNGTGQMFEDRSFARAHLRSELGLVLRGDHGRQIGFGVTLQAAGGREGLVMKGAGIYAAFQRRFGRRTQLSWSANYDELRYPTAVQLNGPRVSMSLKASHILSPRLKMSGSVHLSHHRTEVLFHRRSDAVVAASAEYGFSGGLIAGLEASIGHTRYAQANPLLFQYGPQRDWRAKVTASVMHREFSIYGFAPMVEMGVERQKSNVPMRSYDNIKVSLGATRNF